MAGRPRSKKNWYRFYVPEKLEEEIEVRKYREFLYKDDYDRPLVDPTKIWVAYYKTKERYPSIRQADVMSMLFLDRYEFTTIKHLSDCGLFKGKESIQQCGRAIYNLQRKGWVYKRITNWHIDDKEYKQRFGVDRNRHNYNKRYSLNNAGDLVVNTIFDFLTA